MIFFYLAHALAFLAVVCLLGVAVTGQGSRLLWSWAIGSVVVSLFVASMVALNVSRPTQVFVFWVFFGALMAARLWASGRKTFSMEWKANSWLLTVFVLFCLFQFSFLAIPNAEIITPDFHAMRSHGLYSDCYLSHRFAEMIMYRLDPDSTEFVGDWQITDRGPLVALLFAGEWAAFGFGAHNYPHYAALVITLNSMMLVAGVSLLRRLGGSALATAMLIAMLTLSEWGSFNIWYTWPKCFGTALFVFGIEALFFDRDTVRAGVFVALSMLAHGMALFALPLVFLFFVWPRAQRDWRGLVKFAGALFIVQLPWSLYKTFWHPDYGRLMKMHLFAHPDPTTDSLLAVGRQYWATHSLLELAHIHLTNVVYPFDLTFLLQAVKGVAHGELRSALDDAWLFSFRQLLGAFDLFLVAAVALAIVSWRAGTALVAPALRSHLRWLLALAATGYVVPVVLLGSPDDAMSNHQWVYGTLLVLQLIGSLVLERRWGRAAWCFFVPAAAWELTVLYWHHLCLDLWTTATHSWSLVLNVIALVALICVGCVWPSRKLASPQ